MTYPNIKPEEIEDLKKRVRSATKIVNIGRLSAYTNKGKHDNLFFEFRGLKLIHNDDGTETWICFPVLPSDEDWIHSRDEIFVDLILFVLVPPGCSIHCPRGTYDTMSEVTLVFWIDQQHIMNGLKEWLEKDRKTIKNEKLKKLGEMKLERMKEADLSEIPKKYEKLLQERSAEKKMENPEQTQEVKK